MSALSPAPAPASRGRWAPPLNPLECALTDCCLSYKQNAAVSPLESALTNASHLPDSKHFESPCLDTLAHSFPATPLDSALTKTPGGGVPCAFARHSPLVTRHYVSHQAQWIHIHHHGGFRDLLPLKIRPPPTENLCQQRALRRLQQELKPMLLLQFRQRRRGRSQDPQPFAVVRRKILRELPRPANRFLQVRVAHDDIGQGSERRIPHHPPELRFALVKRTIILAHRILNRVVLRIECLNQNATGQFPTSSAARNLREQLKSSLRGAKIRQTQRRVRADHANQRDTLKIVAFRQHLRANQDVQRAAGKCAQRLLILPLGSRGIAVQPRDPRAGKFLAQPLLQMLRTFAEEINILRLALRTLLRHRLDRTAVVAFEAIAVLVICHRDAAIRALQRCAAAPAQHRPRISAPVDEHQRLRLL